MYWTHVNEATIAKIPDSENWPTVTFGKEKKMMFSVLEGKKHILQNTTANNIKKCEHNIKSRPSVI